MLNLHWSPLGDQSTFICSAPAAISSGRMTSLLAAPLVHTVAVGEAPFLGEGHYRWGQGSPPRPQSPESLGEKEKSSNRAT